LDQPGDVHATAAPKKTGKSPKVAKAIPADKKSAAAAKPKPKLQRRIKPESTPAGKAGKKQPAKAPKKADADKS
jgi:hypothetical protein